MSCRLEPAIWSHDTGQQIPCFDRCQLLITWMSNIKEVHGKPRPHVSINLLFGVWPPCCATPPSSSPSCMCAHEQIFFIFLTSLTHDLSMVKFSEKNQCQKNFARTSLRWLSRVMQDHEARASNLNRKLIFLFFLLFF